MPRISQACDRLLTELEATKNNFGPSHDRTVAGLLARLSALEFADPHQLIRFHECLLFLRAFPHAASQVRQVENLLNTFHERVEKLRALYPDMSSFDDFDTSGIAGTTMQDTLSFDVASWLSRTIPHHVDIAWKNYWDDYQSERARGSTWPRFIPLLEEDGDVEANIPWQRWLDAARGREAALPWLLRHFAQLPLSPRERAELYDSLRLPIRWQLDNLNLSRTRNFATPRRFYFHDAPLIQRSEVSLSDELAKPAPKFEKLSLAAGESVMQAIREIMVVRYRELYGTTLGDPHWVVRADLGRGVVMHFWGLPPSRRLPLRAYVAGYTLKNGVPINYIEAIGLCDWIEVGFNTFYTYRQGETAWVYAQALRCLNALTHATTISIYPYQIGQDNDEAIDSGAFWFYRKLGFRSGNPDLHKLCEREEARIAINPKHRTARSVLTRLAEAHMFYELPGKQQLPANPSLPVSHSNASWTRFSMRNIGLRINRRMAQHFRGDRNKLLAASTASVARALKLNPQKLSPKFSHRSAAEQQSLNNWSLVLALIPDLARWSPAEKQQLIEIIRSKSGRNEMNYFRQTQHHPRLKSELLRLGSKP